MYEIFQPVVSKAYWLYSFISLRIIFIDNNPGISWTVICTVKQTLVWPSGYICKMLFQKEPLFLNLVTVFVMQCVIIACLNKFIWQASHFYRKHFDFTHLQFHAGKLVNSASQLNQIYEKNIQPFCPGTVRI
jgi:hypothetical protein